MHHTTRHRHDPACRPVILTAGVPKDLEVWWKGTMVALTDTALGAISTATHHSATVKFLIRGKPFQLDDTARWARDCTTDLKLKTMVEVGH